MDYINYDFTDMDQTGYPKETTDRRLSTIGSNSSGLTSTAMAYFTGGSASSPLSINSVGGSYLPSSIHIYPINFEKKDLVTNYLNKWNTNEDLTAYKFDIENTYKYEIKDGLATYTISGVDRAEIKYTDSVSIIIGLINTMIDIVTYALVAFTALSLIVSTVMVAIITYVSVVERVKEIGVIRSLGGRKKDVSHLFNAETFIIGLSSGVFGVVFTYIMQLIANVAINAASGGSVAKIANLTPATAIIMILVSIILTAISGIIPARSAARKDPVVALRTE
jgi:putative ABC transport system permease protein